MSGFSHLIIYPIILINTNLTMIILVHSQNIKRD